MGRKRKSDEAAPAPSGASGTATAKPAAKKPATATNNVVAATGPGATAKDSGMVAVTATGAATAAGPTGKAAGGKKAAIKEEFADTSLEGLEMDNDGPHEEEELEMPPSPILYKLVDRLENQLPKDDTVKYDSRCKKIDWKKVAWDELGPADCKKYWNQIQDRIRRFRIMAELIPDARHWIAHPWTNFYKSKDHNRHPDMPKKPLSMYMLFYSEKRAEILVENPKLSMPEVAKICSEQYQKLSDKKKARYKQRCDDMRKEYDERLAKFYRENPTLKPVKAEKVKKEKPPPPPPVVTPAAAAPAPAAPAAPPVAVAPQQQQPQIVTVTMPVQQPLQVDQQAQFQAQPQQQIIQQANQFQPNQAFQIQPQPQAMPQEVALQPMIPQGNFGMTYNGQALQPNMVVAGSVVQTTNANGETIYMVQQPQQQPGRQQFPQVSIASSMSIPQQPVPQQQPIQTMQAVSQAQPQPTFTLQGAPQTVQIPMEQLLPQQQPQPPQPPAPALAQPAPAAPAPVVQPPQPGPSQQPQPTLQPQVQLTSTAYPSAPERPAKPFDLFFKSMMDAHAGDSNFDRQSCAENYRQEWKTMKPKKKAKWIKKAAENFRDYEEKVTSFISKNPGYIPPQHKSFLTQEDQRILDKSMGRPEKPPSSAYSLFSKEMLNNVEIKKYPSKERMAQISEKWKILPQDQKDMYQAEVNRSMSVYRQKYEDWFNALDENERKAETNRMSSTKSTRAKQHNAAVAAAQQAQQQSGGVVAPTTSTPTMPTTPIKMEPKIVPVPAQGGTPVGPPISLGPVMMPATSMGAQMQPQQPQVITAQPMPIIQPAPPQQLQMVPIQNAAAAPAPGPSFKDQGALRAEILRREPTEPARSPRQLFLSEYTAKHRKKKPQDAKDAWKALDKKDKKKWMEKLEPQRQKYIEEYTVFVRGLDKEELEMYTELKQRRDEEEDAARQNESSDSDSDSSDSDESDSDSDSDSD